MLYWQAEALAGIRRARRCANALHHEIADVKHYLLKLRGYKDEHVSMTDTIDWISCVVEVLFEIEGKLSCPA